jgi:hypothetical protein
MTSHGMVRVWALQLARPERSDWPQHLTVVSTEFSISLARKSVAKLKASALHASRAEKSLCHVF